MTTATLSGIFGRTDRAGNVHLLDSEGRPVTTTSLLDTTGVWSTAYTQTGGVIVTRAGADALGIEINGSIEETGDEADALEALFNQITDGVLEGVRTGAWDFSRRDNNGALAVEFYADGDPRYVSLSDSYRSALVHRLDAWVAGRRAEAAA